jgi:uncharacterized YigZ family protein
VVPVVTTNLLGVESYLVPAREAVAEIEVKRSRFRCRLVRIASEEAARAVIADERRTQNTAGHHCSALVVGPGAKTVRSSDDGEPSGTAGPPILDALRGAGLSDVVAVVSRWFGGTLLGTGGLVQAYGDATRAALVTAGSRRRALSRRLEITVDLATVGRLEDLLLREGADVRVDYGPGAATMVATAPGDPDRLQNVIMTATGGRAVISSLSPTWVDLPR